MKRFRLLPILGILLALMLLVAWPPRPAFAAQVLHGDTVTVAGNQTIDDDVYSFGTTITIDGTVRGDVVAIGGTVNVNGTVTGSVNVAAGTIAVSGRVEGALRAAGSDITIDGRIGKDALVAGSTVDLGASAQVGRDVNVAARTATLDGHVGRNVAANVQTLHIGNAASVHGTLSYGSDKADIAPGAVIQGAVRHTHYDSYWPGTWQVWTTGAWPSMVAFAWLRGFFSLAVLGVIFLLIAPRLGSRTVATLRARPWVSLGIGLAVLIGVPIAIVLAFALGVFIGGWWLALLALAIYVTAVALSLPISGLFIGQWLLQQAGARNVWPGAAMMLGLALVMLVSLVPILGALAVCGAVLFGLGALALSLRGTMGSEAKGTPEKPSTGADLRPLPRVGEMRHPVDATSA